MYHIGWVSGWSGDLWDDRSGGRIGRLFAGYEENP